MGRIRKVAGPAKIGVQCLSGMGRGPMLVALALVYKGCPGIDAIKLIRNNIPGSLNIQQANIILEFNGGVFNTEVKKNENAKCVGCSIF